MISFEEAEIRAKIIKAIAHPVRLMIIDLLKNKEQTFSNINNYFELDKSTVSKHLSVLKEAGIVSSKKVQKESVYKLEIPCVIEFFECSTKVIRHNMKKHQAVVDKDYST